MCTSLADPDLIFFSAFPVHGNNGIFMFVSGMLETWKTLVHGDINVMQLSSGVLQSFLLTL